MDKYLDEVVAAINALPDASVDMLQQELARVRRTHNRVFICGNGGSQAVAVHWGVDLIKVCGIDIYTLGTNQALHTALANDLDYDVGLSTELSMRAQPGDVLIALSCSGRSTNIVSVLGQAKRLDIVHYLITGAKAPTYLGTRMIQVASNDYGVLEDVFSMIGHVLTRRLVQ